MSNQKFHASLSKGRKSWCVIFRHPLRTDSDGRPGLRVRRGLGTEDETTARGLVEQLNEILDDESYWRPSAKEEALRKFDERIVTAFFHEIEVKAEDPWKVRDEVIPLPGKEEGYSRTLLVGATGAGKTTLLRQLIGTHPIMDRFPSTATAKTTIFDTEIVLEEGAYRGVVSFLPRDQVRSYIEECVVAAVTSASEKASEERVLEKLLEHSEQRFRLKYLLGTLHSDEVEEGDDDSDCDIPNAGTPLEMSDMSDEEKSQMEIRLRSFLDRLVRTASDLQGSLEKQLEINSTSLKLEDRDAFLELIEYLINGNEEAQSLIDDILEEVEGKFSLLEGGIYERDRTEWPRRWSFETDDRNVFIKTINKFSSNYAPLFGKLLAPVVQGLRVAGPFRASWYSQDRDLPKLVFIDGEGLGHTPSSAATLPTSVTKRYQISDVILLVDNATQPMQAASQSVLRSVSASGHDSKLVVVFTHFDQVKGDNLPNTKARQNHVMASLENSINATEEAIASNAGKRLRHSLIDGDRIYFVSRIEELLHESNKLTHSSLNKLIPLLESAATPPKVSHFAPIYDMANLVLCVHKATEQFHEHWQARLGLTHKSDVQTEHWTRVKALSRRFANQWEDQYDSLRPVADMIKQLSERLAHFIANPRAWEPTTPAEEAYRHSVEQVSQEVYTRLHTLIGERLFNEHLNEWGKAYALRDKGSAFKRAHEIQGIYETSTPIPGETPSLSSNDFLDAIRTLFKEAATAAGAKVI